ncbi:MAG TPA: FHA domain-containing protein [candidate division Zixibacteria bacterium]|nr:FHA domain-containing protein [candidate division Zixibacteria bacterium]
MSKRNLILWGIVAALFLVSNAFAIKVESLPRIKLPGGTGDSEVSNVKAIYVGPGGEIYIGSARNNLVQVFSGNGQYLRSIPIGDDDIEVPQDIDIGIDGLVYVVDRDRDELSRFTQEGMRQGTIGGEKTFGRPMSVTVARDGRVYVADKDKDNVRIFDEDGQDLGTLQGAGFEDPIAVDVDHQGRVFVLDEKKKTVQVFNSEGSLIIEIPVQFGGKEIGEPVDLCVNQHGELFVLDKKEKVVFFTADFESGQWEAPFSGGMLDEPISVDVAGRDVCYVLDNKNETIWKFALTELPSLVAEKTVKETIIKKAVISSNVDSTENITINRVIPSQNLVVLSVFEDNRNIVSGLIAENFPGIKVGEQELEIQKAHPQFREDEIDFIFLLGTVGLKENEINLIKEKLTTEFLAKLDESRHRVAFFKFADNIELAMPLEKSFSTQKTAINNLQFNGQKAPLYDAVLEALNYYDTSGAEKYPIFVVVTNSKGESSRNNFKTLEDYKRSHDLPQIYTLGYDNEKSPEFLEEIRKIADLSGGFFYSADKDDMIYFLFRRSIALIRGQYALAVSGLPVEGEISVSVDVDMDGNLITSSHEYSEPSGEEVAIKGESFLEKYGLILLIVLIVVILLIIIIIIVAASKKGKKAQIGEAMLEVKSGDAPQHEFHLMKGTNKIGADKANDIHLPSEGVSRNHATIEYSGGKYELIDQGSTNGTMVNKNRITRRVLINNDVISIGQIDLIFKTG